MEKGRRAAEHNRAIIEQDNKIEIAIQLYTLPYYSRTQVYIKKKFKT
jgi:hypothetical protein